MPENSKPERADERPVSAVPRLPLARYRLRFVDRRAAGEPSALSGGYLGSAWRGAFGRALRQTVCVTRMPACDPCLLLRSCPYPFLFESRTPPGAEKLSRYPRTPGPYVLEPGGRAFGPQASGRAFGAQGGDRDDRRRIARGGDHDERHDGDRAATHRHTVNLGLTLFGFANERLPYAVHALQRAGRQGLTSRRVALDLIDVQAEQRGFRRADEGDRPGEVGTNSRREAGVNGRSAADPGQWATVFAPGSALTPLAPEHPAPPDPPDRVLVRLLTPLRIRRGGHLVGVSQFDFHAFLGGLLRRISLLTYFFGDERLETGFAGLLRRAASISTMKRELRWHAWTRYSSRQKAALRMDGIVGSFELEGAGLDEFWPYLWLGQWTHAGKGTSMGLGWYVLEPASVRDPRGAEARNWQGPRPLFSTGAAATPGHPG